MGKTTSAREELMAQMRTYRKRLPPFDVSFWDNESPQLWWSSIEDCFAEGEDYICQLAMKLFAITPHAAACERIWSMLGWYYGKRRTRLALHKLESMQKLAAFYISNAKKELPYYGVDKTAGELRQIINEMNIFGDDDDEDTIPDSEDPDTERDIEEEAEEEENLIIERWVNLNAEEFSLDFDGEIEEVRVFIDDNEDNEDNENNEDNEDNGTNENNGTNEDNEDNEDNENNEDGEEWDPEEAADRYTRD